MSRSLLYGGLAGAAAMLALWSPTERALGSLASARAERAALPAASAGSATGIAPALAVQGPRPSEALATHLRRMASAGGVLVEQADPLGVEPRGVDPLARVRLRVSGSSRAVIGFADAVERGRPLVRFARWRLETVDGAVRLTGEAVAPWR